jgi:hypothetical protein
MRIENRRLCARRKEHGLPRRNQSVCRGAAVACFLAGRGVTKETVLGGSYGINGAVDGYRKGRRKTAG